MHFFSDPLTFEWDEGNHLKNWNKHKVSTSEIEEVFFDDRKKIFPDPVHSNQEIRKLLIGKTRKGRLLFVVFTIRNLSVRVISARDLNKREKELYEKTN